MVRMILEVLWSGWYMPVKFYFALAYSWASLFGILADLTLNFTLLKLIITYFWNLLGQTTIVTIIMPGLSNDSLRLSGKSLGHNLRPDHSSEVNLISPTLIVILSYGGKGLSE